MDELFLRANILKRSAYGKKVFIYEDHRYILNILHRAFQKKILDEPVTVIYFDKHDDGRKPLPSIDRLKNYRNTLPNERDFWGFVEWELSGQDGDWVKTGMELGLIGDVILIGCHDPDNFTEFSNEYEDHLGLIHHIFNVGTIWDGLSHQGWLIDTAQDHKYSPIWNLIGLTDHTFLNLDSDQKKTKFIIDFDLDCFTTQLEKFVVPWPFEYFERLFNNSLNYGIKPSDFVIELIKKSEFVTIARESDFCGSIYNSNIIFENLNQVLFQNNL